MNNQMKCALPGNVVVKCDPAWCAKCAWAPEDTEPERKDVREKRRDDTGRRALLVLAGAQAMLLGLKLCGLALPWWIVLLPIEGVAALFVGGALAVLVWLEVQLAREDRQQREIERWRRAVRQGRRD